MSDQTPPNEPPPSAWDAPPPAYQPPPAPTWDPPTAPAPPPAWGDPTVAAPPPPPPSAWDAPPPPQAYAPPPPPAYAPPAYGAPAPYAAVPAGYAPKSKMAAGLLGIFLGAFGIHNFYLGYTGKAVAQLILCVFTCGFVSGIWGLIEGIMILTGSINTDARGVPLAE